jgi:hypothetical protein
MFFPDGRFGYLNMFAVATGVAGLDFFWLDFSGQRFNMIRVWK